MFRIWVRHLGSYHFLAHGRGGAGGNGGTGGSSKYNRLKRGDQEKNNVIEGGGGGSNIKHGYV